MLTKIRIEVEEESAEKCVETLSKYEHAIQQQEAKRFQYLWPVNEEGMIPIEDYAWKVGIGARPFYSGELGREIVEEVIEFDPGLPGYKGRRVVIFARIDTRHPVYAGDPQATAEANNAAVKVLTSLLPKKRT